MSAGPAAAAAAAGASSAQPGNCGQALLKIFAALLLLGCLGGFAFSYLEREAELVRYELNRAIYRSLTGSVDFEHCHKEAFRDVGFCRQHRELEHRLRLFFEQAGNSLVDRRQWTWLGSFFFIFHLSSTVGYATQGAPATPGGQCAAIVFGLLGIPLFGGALLLASKWLLLAAKLLFRRCLGPSGSPEAERLQMIRLAAILAVSLWLAAAWLFKLLEGWSFARALFFCFMTFSTVGIGTDVPSTLPGCVAATAYAYVSLSLSVGLLRALAGPRAGGAAAEEAPLLAMLASGRELGEGPRQKRAVARACLAAVVCLCLLGALVFPALEREAELQRYSRSRSVFDDLNALAEFQGCDQEFIRKMDFCRNVGWFRERLRAFFGPDTPNSFVDREHWTPVGSASFMLSVASTVGYGPQSPHTREGKVVTVFLGMLVVPLFWYCMLVWGSSFHGAVQRLAEKAKLRSGVLNSAGENATLDLLVVALVLWLVGSVAFCLVEGWSYSASLYFCFVTLSAVGFATAMPRTVAGRALMLLYIAVGLTSAASLVGDVAYALVLGLGVRDEELELQSGAGAGAGTGTSAPATA